MGFYSRILMRISDVVLRGRHFRDPMPVSIAERVMRHFFTGGALGFENFQELSPNSEEPDRKNSRN